MATCKDCLHYEACVDMLQAMGYTVDGEGYLADRRCRIFKSKDNYSEVKHGRWLTVKEYAKLIGADMGSYEGWVYCSECGQPMRYLNGWSYCPCCGTKMKRGTGNVD